MRERGDARRLYPLPIEGMGRGDGPPPSSRWRPGLPGQLSPHIFHPKLIPAPPAGGILAPIPPRLARARTRAWGVRADGSRPGRQRYRRAWGSLPAASGPLRRPSRFNSRSNSRCTGGWWVHGSKGGPLPFRLLNGFDYRFGRCEVVAKTWHCHGAAKAASEINRYESGAPPSRPLSGLGSAHRSSGAAGEGTWPYFFLRAG